MKLINVLHSRFLSSLKRKGIITPVEWAEAYRIMPPPFPGKWSFTHHPWLKELHLCENDFIVIQKSAQMGFTESLLNLTFYAIDVKGISVLYVLPNQTPDATDFSAARFNPALELSPYLKNLFSDVKNVGHKRAGAANLYIRGSNSRSGLKSIPVSKVILDEVDEMDPNNIELAFERVAGQLTHQTILNSTPRYEDIGINKYFKNSSQDLFYFPCPSCSRYTNFSYPESLVITGQTINDPDLVKSYLICKLCKAKLEHNDKINFLRHGKWIKSFSNKSRGFHINQMYSLAVTPYDLAKKAVAAQFDPTIAQEFYNSKMGLCFLSEDARINDHEINECIGSHTLETNSNNRNIVMGIDVGTYIHVEISQYINNKCKVLAIPKLTHFEELDYWIKNFNPTIICIDANPERRKAVEFATRYLGRVFLIFYGNVKGRHLEPNEINLVVDRTTWMDASLSRFRNKSIILPINISLEYREHIKAPIRILTKDNLGNIISKYEHKLADHYAHARTYNEIGYQLLNYKFESYNITSPI